MTEKLQGCRELLPCPFCRSEAKSYITTLAPHRKLIRCSDDRCVAAGKGVSYLKWNTRAYQSRPQDASKELVDKFQKLFELMGDVLTPEQWLQVYELTETVELDPKHLNTYNTHNKVS